MKFFKEYFSKFAVFFLIFQTILLVFDKLFSDGIDNYKPYYFSLGFVLLIYFFEKIRTSRVQLDSNSKM